MISPALRFSVCAIACISSALYSINPQRELTNKDLYAIYEQNIKKPTDKIITEINNTDSLYTMTTREDAHAKLYATLPKIKNFANKETIDPAVKQFVETTFNDLYAKDFAPLDRIKSHLLSIEDNMKTYAQKTKKETGVFKRIKNKLSDKKVTYVSAEAQEKARREVLGSIKQLRGLQDTVQNIKDSIKTERNNHQNGSAEKQLLLLLEFFTVSINSIINAIIIKTEANLA